MMDPPVIPRQAWALSTSSGVETIAPPPPPPQSTVQSLTSPSSSSSSSSSPSNSSKYEASTEIQDIDARLAQLQNFLRAAKSGEPLPTL
jgi:hypothetical protein